MINYRDVANFIENRDHIKLTDIQLDMLKAIIGGDTIYTVRQSGRSLLYNGYAEYLKQIESQVDYSLIPDGYDLVFGIPCYANDPEMMKKYNTLKAVLPESAAIEFECKKPKPKPIKILGVVGASGTGKDTLINTLTNYNLNVFNKVVKVTTRPKRSYELHDIDYKFLMEQNFDELVKKGHVVGITEFNNWKYAIDTTALNDKKINVVELNPTNIIHNNFLRELKNIDIEVDFKIVRTEASDKDRLIRCLSREPDPDVQEILRRYSTDIDKHNDTKFFDALTQMNSDDIFTMNTSINTPSEEYKMIIDWLKKDNWL